MPSASARERTGIPCDRRTLSARATYGHAADCERWAQKTCSDGQDAQHMRYSTPARRQARKTAISRKPFPRAGSGPLPCARTQALSSPHSSPRTGSVQQRAVPGLLAIARFVASHPPASNQAAGMPRRSHLIMLIMANESPDQPHDQASASLKDLLCHELWITKSGALIET